MNGLLPPAFFRTSAFHMTSEEGEQYIRFWRFTLNDPQKMTEGHVRLCEIRHDGQNPLGMSDTVKGKDISVTEAFNKFKQLQANKAADYDIVDDQDPVYKSMLEYEYARTKFFGDIPEADIPKLETVRKPTINIGKFSPFSRN